MRTCERTHPWINFELNPGRLDASIWSLLDQARAKSSHIEGIALGPATTRELQLVSLVRAVRASAAIEGNPLSEAQVRAQLKGRLLLPRDEHYYGQEVANIAQVLQAMDPVRKPDGNANLSVPDILHTHERVLRDLPLEAHVIPGQLRTPGQHVRVGGYPGAPP
ncbi:MAG: hypothetical protein OXB89_11930, partial [Anaerolineaceae bacterium]|nr:hypothetical protein [Anaerolineaceae bacterium]